MNELPFGSWIAAGSAFDEACWNESVEAHERGMRHLHELGAGIVAGTRPRGTDALRTNEAFIGSEAVHTKQYFPDEEGFYEARWFDAGERHFRLAPAGALQCGFLICTELMFNEHARHYGRAGAHAILVPRATGTSLDRWLVAMRMAAIVSGSYVLSSNRSGGSFGGRGWIIDPSGTVIGATSEETPAAFYEIDTEVVAQAQRDYPCYVREI
ncbi:MAG TPA: carbon-nitrogen hydrolase family protein [Thermoanaerobaculia bacterium]|nr:carbon-nitrogen hydrolase family protein [Thermoanaerobaculia bacterium]